MLLALLPGTKMMSFARTRKSSFLPFRISAKFTGNCLPFSLLVVSHQNALAHLGRLHRPACPSKGLSDAKILLGWQSERSGAIDFADDVDRLRQPLLDMDDIAAADHDVERQVALFQQISEVDFDVLFAGAVGRTR